MDTPDRDAGYGNSANEAGNTWVLILAAGDGTRLRSLTTDSSGLAVPKQFCSLREESSLLEDALFRAAMVAPASRHCVVVARQHRRWWESSLRALPRQNIIVQPENRGTAHGLLLPLLHIVQRDPNARILMLPADHHVRDELTLAKAMHQALDSLQSCDRSIVLLGLEPEQCDPDLGYILPGPADANGIAEIDRFVEKPTAILARQLINRGGLWNAFILASSAATLMALFKGHMHSTVDAMKKALQHDRRTPGNPSLLAELYGQLQTVDFSRDILQSEERLLRVLRVGPCGWSDLGTPERVARALRRISLQNSNAVRRAVRGRLNLASQQARIAGERRETGPGANGDASRAGAV